LHDRGARLVRGPLGRSISSPPLYRAAGPTCRASGHGSVMTGRAGDATPAMPPTSAEIPIVARENLQGHYAGFASRFVAFVVDMVVITGAFMLVLPAINFSASV